jgi:hypothetical protein
MTTLQDRFGRSIDYLRLSVTDRCDLRCSYCIPKGFKDFEEPENWLTFDEIERVVAAFARLGTRRVRLTGGEPLLRRNLPQLAARLAALPGLQIFRSVPTPPSWRAMHANCTRLGQTGQCQPGFTAPRMRQQHYWPRQPATGDGRPAGRAGCGLCSDQDQYGGNERCK